MVDECVELKNIKYRTMLLNGISDKEEEEKKEILNIDNFLDNEMKTNEKVSWNKLDNSNKLKKIEKFINKFSKENNLKKEEITRMKEFFKINLERKKFQKIKEVNYDKDKGEIASVPIMIFNEVTRNFSIKRSEKKISLGTVKRKGSKKNKKLKTNNITVKNKAVPKSPRHLKSQKKSKSIIKNNKKSEKKVTSDDNTV